MSSGESSSIGPDDRELLVANLRDLTRVVEVLVFDVTGREDANTHESGMPSANAGKGPAAPPATLPDSPRGDRERPLGTSGLGATLHDGPRVERHALGFRGPLCDADQHPGRHSVHDLHRRSPNPRAAEERPRVPTLPLDADVGSAKGATCVPDHGMSEMDPQRVTRG